MNKTLRQIIHFFSASIVGFFINLGVLYVLTDFIKIYYIISAILAFIVSHLYSFTFNEKITFQKKRKDYFKRWIKFFLVNVLALMVNLALLYAFTEYFHIYYILSQIIASMLTFSINFVLNKFWTFI